MKPFFLTVLVLLSVSANTFADDWPQWRGPQRDGVWRETGVVASFDKPQLDIAWRAKIGSGYSGPSVAHGRVYVTDRIVEPKQVERVHCFDAKTGKPLWSHGYDAPYVGVGYDAGPRASVLIDDGRAYSLGAMGHFFCFKSDDGKVLWQKDLNAEYKIRMPVWGIAASPIIFDDLVIVQIGGEGEACLVAFDKASGKERWRSFDDSASYAAPIFIEQAGKPVLVCYTGGHVIGVDPTDGRVLWQHPFPATRVIIGVATPVFHEGHLFMTNFFDGSLVLRVHPSKFEVDQVWLRRGESENDTDALQSIIATPIVKGDHVYGVDSYGELRCLELKTGDRVWESLAAVPKARWANIHLVEQGDRTWLFNERGELIIARLDPRGYHEISRAKLIEPTRQQLNQRDGVCWSHPAFANRCVYARNDEELVCADLSAD